MSTNAFMICGRVVLSDEKYAEIKNTSSSSLDQLVEASKCCGRSYERTYTLFTSCVDASLDRLNRENKLLRDALVDARSLLEHGNFKNDVTGPHGYPDEGEVRAYEMIESIDNLLKDHSND